MARPARARPRRKLNIARIKAVIVSCVGAVMGVGSALTGLGAQVAFAPLLNWMLGFGPEKAQATAMRYAAFTALFALVGFTLARGLPAGFLVSGIALFVGATAGAIFAAPPAKSGRLVSHRAATQAVGIGLMIFVIVQTTRQSNFENHYFAVWQSPWQLALLAIGVGALTQVLGLASGTIMVPTLYYLAGFDAVESVLLSLLVITLASALPTWSYSRQGLVDNRYGVSATFGGILGGGCGGFFLARLSDRPILYLFAVVSMFLCARELARLAANPPRAVP